MKPDLVVPGTVLLAAKSHPSNPTMPDPNFGGHYTYHSGTSMATPCAARAATIVRQYYLKELGHEPSVVLLRATMINGSFWIKDQVAEDDRVNQTSIRASEGLTCSGLFR